jgi:hypothetical protein
MMSNSKQIPACASYPFEKRKCEMVVSIFFPFLSSLAVALLVATEELPTSLLRAKAAINASLFGTLVVVGVVGWLAFPGLEVQCHIETGEQADSG